MRSFLFTDAKVRGRAIWSNEHMKTATLKDLRQDPQNARKHNPRNIGMIESSLRQVGAARSGVIDENGVILAGNGTYEALVNAGINKIKIVEADGEEWVVVRRKGLTEEQKRILAVSDNRAGDLAEWDGPVLDAQGIDLAPWFSGGELRKLGIAKVNSEPVEPSAELLRKWFGRHRLICADAVEINLTGDLICTDPPFDLDARELVKIFDRTGAGRATVLCTDRQAMALGALWRLRIQLIWRHRRARSFPSKNMPIFYHACIPCLTDTDQRKLLWQRPDPTFGSVIEVDEEYDMSEHRHGKGHEIFERMLAGFAQCERVIEPFAGSGAVIIASERLGKTCMAVEKEPTTVAAALERWSIAFPAEQPKRVRHDA